MGGVGSKRKPVQQQALEAIKMLVLGTDVFDTAGMEDFSAVRDTYMRIGHAFYFVYSVTCRASFEEIENLEKYIRSVKEDDHGKIPMVLCGNKRDLNEHREVSTQEGEELAKKLGMVFFETSAKENENITEAFTELVREFRKNPKQEERQKSQAKAKK